MTTLITNAEQASETLHVEGVEFICSQCGKQKPVQTSGGTGYARTRDTNALVCYECCGLNDRESLSRGESTVLYITDQKITNWPGTLSIQWDKSRVSKRGGGFGSQRTDVWFRFAGRHFHGVNRGDSQILRVKAIKP